MRLLIIDTELQGLDIAMRAANAGHEVRLYRFTDGKPNQTGEGIKEITLVDEWRSSLEWIGKDGFALVTGNHRFLHELDRAREMGVRVFGPSVASARLEIDRGAGMRAMQAAGVDIPEYHEFSDLESAYRFARRTQDPFCFKPLGDEADKAMTYVSDDPADLVGWLEKQIKSGKKLRGRCILQVKIDAISELGVSGWMGPEGFLPDRWHTCVEHKKLHSGEIGPATGEQGTVCQYSEDDLLAGEMLLPLEPILRTLGHRGDFAVGAIVDTKGKAWFLEVTARCGWPAFHIQVASHRGDPIRWMSDLLDGKDSLKVSYDVGIGVVLSQPMYPYDKSPNDLVEGNPIRYVESMPPGTDLHLVGAMKARGPVFRDGRIVYEQEFQTTMEYVAVVTALGKTISRARDKVYSALDERVKFSGRSFRDDIGEKVIAALPELHKFGYLTSMKA